MVSDAASSKAVVLMFTNCLLLLPFFFVLAFFCGGGGGLGGPCFFIVRYWFTINVSLIAECTKGIELTPPPPYLKTCMLKCSRP